MATLKEAPYGHALAYKSITCMDEQWILKSRSSTIDIGDVLQIFKVPRDAKVVGASVATLQGVTSATIDLRITDGTTTKVLVDDAPVAAVDVVTEINKSDALGWVVPGRGFRLEAVVAGANLTANTQLVIGLRLSFVGWPGELATKPTGSA